MSSQLKRKAYSKVCKEGEKTRRQPAADFRIRVKNGARSAWIRSKWTYLFAPLITKQTLQSRTRL